MLQLALGALHSASIHRLLCRPCSCAASSCAMQSQERLRSCGGLQVGTKLFKSPAHRLLTDSQQVCAAAWSLCTQLFARQTCARP